MFTKKHTGIGLAAFVVALAATALVATAASATRLTPEEEVVLRSTNSKYIWANAFAENFLTCSNSETTLFTPEEGAQKRNTNRVGTGTFSEGDGSVSVELEPVEFGGTCSVVNAPSGQTIGAVTVENLTSARWRGAIQWAEPAEFAKARILIPRRALRTNFTFQGTTCSLLFVSPEFEDLVMGEYYVEEEEILEIDGQVYFAPEAGEPNEASCTALGLTAAVSPAQFEGDYEVVAGELVVEE